MKKKLCCLTILLGVFICLFYAPRIVFANGDIQINDENFPDKAFQSFVAGNFDTDNDWVLSTSELEAVTRIDIDYDFYSVSSLKGVEYFTKLQTLKVVYRIVMVVQKSVL